MYLFWWILLESRVCGLRCDVYKADSTRLRGIGTYLWFVHGIRPGWMMDETLN